MILVMLRSLIMLIYADIAITISLSKELCDWLDNFLTAVV